MSNKAVKASGTFSGLVRQLSSYWFYSALLLALVIMFSLIQTRETYRIEQGTPLTIDTPRLVMHKVNATQFAANGAVEMTINADGLAQFIDNRLSASNPLIVLFNENQPRTFIRSARGDVRGPHLHMTGQVEVATNQQAELMRGETLDYNHDSNLMLVTDPVLIIRTPDSLNEIRAAMLRAHGDTENLELLNGVTTHITRVDQ